MSITTFALAASALCAIPAVAEAKPHRLVVKDFDGPSTMADAGRSAVTAMLAEEHDLVATDRWTEARHVGEDGAGMWLAAARETGVEAVITGWVQLEDGERYSLTVQVLEAASGLELDSFSVTLTDAGLTEEATKELHADFEDLFSTDAIATVDDEPEAADEPTATLPGEPPHPRFKIDGGLFICTRSFTLVADDPELVQYPGSEPEVAPVVEGE